MKRAETPGDQHQGFDREKLLVLSRTHLKAAEEEDWGLWEGVAGERERVYRVLASVVDKGIPFPAETLEEIVRLDETILALLRGKRETAIRDLLSLRSARRRGHPCGQTASRSRFRVSC